VIVISFDLVVGGSCHTKPTHDSVHMVDNKIHLLLSDLGGF
jgi:hypothetical protein